MILDYFISIDDRPSYMEVGEEGRKEVRRFAPTLCKLTQEGLGPLAIAML